MFNVAEIIKKHIKLRGKSNEQLAKDLNIPVKTLYDKLQNNRISTEELFKISIILDIDLEWMKGALGYTKSANVFERKGIKRMSKMYREQEYGFLLESMNRCVSEGCGTVIEIKKELLATHGSLFYILDVLLDETYCITIVKERSREVVYVQLPWSENNPMKHPPLEKGTNMLSCLITGILKG